MGYWTIQPIFFQVLTKKPVVWTPIWILNPKPEGCSARSLWYGLLLTHWYVNSYLSFKARRYTTTVDEEPIYYWIFSCRNFQSSVTWSNKECIVCPSLLLKGLLLCNLSKLFLLKRKHHSWPEGSHRCSKWRQNVDCRARCFPEE